MTFNATQLSELSPRVIPLFDGRSGIRSALSVEIHEPGPQAGLRAATPSDSPSNTQSSAPAILDFTSSDDTLDRYGEIIVASGWRLENFRRNPVFQNAHQYGDVIFTLGRALVTEVRAGGTSSRESHSSSPILFQRIQFATDVNPMARITYGLYKGKFLNAVSVGFIPVRWENGGPEAGYRRKYLEQELLEVSAVAIPANPNALALGLKSGAVAKGDLRDTMDMLMRLIGQQTASSPCSDSHSNPHSRSTDVCRTSAGSETDTCALGSRAMEAQLLQLARALKEALKH